MAHEVLDARGLLCPLPVIRTQDRVRTMPPGSVLEVLATDPGTLHDIPAWCRVHGHELLSVEEVDSVGLQEEPFAERTAARAAQTAAKGAEIRIRLRITG